MRLSADHVTEHYSNSRRVWIVSRAPGKNGFSSVRTTFIIPIVGSRDLIVKERNRLIFYEISSEESLLF